MGIRIEDAGLLTTVQDGGRFGAQRFGVPVSGAMDTRSYTLACLLAGCEGGAVLEATLQGPTLTFTEANSFAVTGADLGACLNGQPIEMYHTLAAFPGDVLSFTGRVSGCRAYIAFGGGLSVPVQMGSRSSYAKAGMGLFGGRKLKVGDEIAFDAPSLDAVGRHTAPLCPDGQTVVLRALPGPQDDAFTEEGLETFFGSEYKVTAESDRMGVRLAGPAVTHKKDANIISDGIPAGAVQIPGSGQPIVMTADHQTTGGYTKIACVVTADLPLMAQCMHGDTVRFQRVSAEEAEESALAEAETLTALKAQITSLHSKCVRRLQMTVNGQTTLVTVAETEEQA